MADEEQIPTVIAENAHIIYRIHGSVSAAQNSPVSSFKRLVTRTKSTAVREVRAVKGVSFVAYKGEAIGLIGTNGSGKSTLLRAIAGLLPVEAGGAIYAAGQPSLLGVNAALMNDLPGERNVVLGCLAMGMSPAEVKSQVKDIIEFSGINERGDFSSLPMRTYSSGMYGRLAFAVAVMMEPDILLIDEALSVGDARFRRKCARKMRELCSEDRTVVLVSHALGTIGELADQAIWIHKGELRMWDDPEGVVDAYTEFLEVGEDAFTMEDV